MGHSEISNIFFQIFTQLLSRFNRILLLVLFVVGGIIGFVKTYLSEDVYKSRVVAESPYINNEITINLLNDLNSFVKEKEFSFVSKKLGLSIEKVQLLQDISSKRIEEEKGRKSIESNHFTIHIETVTNDLTSINSIFAGLFQLIRNNPYIKRKIEFEQKQIAEYKIEVAKKIDELELLQTKSVNEISVTQEFFSYHDVIVDLYDKQSELDRELQNTLAIVIIDNDAFPIKIKPDFFGKTLNYAVGLTSIWLSILILIAFIKFINKASYSDESSEVK